MIALLLVGAVSYLHFRSKPPREATTQLPLNRRRTVAVLNFKNSTSRPEAAWLSTALPEMLTTELAAGEKLRTITGEEVAQMKMNLSLPDSDTLAAQTLSQVGKTLGADLVVLGSYVALPGGKLRVDLHLQDVAAGETLLSVNQTGDENNLFDLVSRAGTQLREKCGAGQAELRRTRPASAPPCHLLLKPQNSTRKALPSCVSLTPSQLVTFFKERWRRTRTMLWLTLLWQRPGLFSDMTRRRVCRRRARTNSRHRSPARTVC